MGLDGVAVYGAQQEARQQALAAQQAARAVQAAARRAEVIAAAERVHMAMHEAAASRLSREIAEMQDTAAKDAARAEAKRQQMREDLDRCSPKNVVINCQDDVNAELTITIWYNIELMQQVPKQKELQSPHGHEGRLPQPSEKLVKVGSQHVSVIANG